MRTRVIAGTSALVRHVLSISEPAVPFSFSSRTRRRASDPDSTSALGLLAAVLHTPACRSPAGGTAGYQAHFAAVRAHAREGVVADAAIEKLTDEDCQLLTKRATAVAAERIADLVADIAEELADDYVYVNAAVIGNQRAIGTGSH